MKTTFLSINTQYIVERDVAELMVKRFVDSSFDKHKTYAHAAGYMEVFLGRVLMEVPKKKREMFLNQLLKDTNSNRLIKESSNA